MAIDAFLESLREEAKLPLAKSSKSYLRNLCALHGKVSTLNKMNEDKDFIPRSARLKFSIKSDTKTSALEEFKALKEETDLIVQETKTKLREKIVDTLSIETSNRSNLLADSIINGLHLCTQIALAEKGKPAKLATKATRDAYATLAQSIEETTPVSGTALDNKLSQLFPPDGITDAIPATAATRISELFTALFVVPVRKWNEAHNEKQIRDRLQQINANLVKEATNNTVVAMETEESVSQEKIAQLIKQAVTKETAALKKEVERLKSGKKQPAKKESRGRRSGASEKQKRSKSKSNNRNRRKVRFSEGNERADADANGSSQGGGILRQSSYRTSQNRRRNGSNNNSNQRRNERQRR